MNWSGLFVSGFFVVGLAVVGWKALGPTDSVQGHSMVPPDTSEIAQGAPLVTVVLPEELSAEAQIGKRGFEAKCAECHGQNAAGQNGIAPPLVYMTYEPNHHSDQAFVSAARNGVTSHHWSFGNMPVIKGLTNAEITYIVRYVRELQRANGIN
jgi:mono/diheme cytochrome c family protein